MAASLSVRPRTCWTEDGSQLAWKNLETPGGAAAAPLGRLPTKLRAAKTQWIHCQEPQRQCFVCFDVCVRVAIAVFVDSGSWSFERTFRPAVDTRLRLSFICCLIRLFGFFSVSLCLFGFSARGGKKAPTAFSNQRMHLLCNNLCIGPTLLVAES